MKDYELDRSKKGQFILNFREKGDKIIVNYANGDSITIANTEKNHDILDKNMREQIKYSGDFYARSKRDYCISLFFASVAFLSAVMTGLPLGLNAVAGKVLFVQLIFVLSSICTLVGVESVFSALKKMQDITKNKRFLEIEDTLNGRVKENQNMIYNTHNVTKKIVKNSLDNKVVFTINNIDKVPFSDLEQIMSNIEREDRFNFEYNELESVKVKKKTK